MIGKIARMPLREVWRNEARDFTTWLLENTDAPTDIIELTLQDPKREHTAGDFHVDLVAEDDEGKVVVIENQLEKSNHDHLGKIITYVASLEAKSAIWIVSDPRPEHVKAITWLNESGLADFYLLKVEAIKIGNSEPAPLLTLITGPSEESRELGDTKKDLADRYGIRRHFWDTLLKHAREKTRLHEAISPSSYSFIWTGAGKAGLGFRYNITQHEAEVSLYINRDSEQENRAILSQLKSHEVEIESAFGRPLIWYQQDGVRHCRVTYLLKDGGYRDPEDRWPAIQDAMINAMVDLDKAIRPHLGAVSIPTGLPASAPVRCFSTRVALPKCPPRLVRSRL
jgi:hypothetical protein